MRDSTASSNSQNHHSISIVQRGTSLITARRMGYTLAGAIVITSASIALQAQANSNESPTITKASQLTSVDIAPNRKVSDTSKQEPGTQAKVTVSSNTNTNPKVNVTVNGKNISVPTNTTSKQTTVNPGGGVTSTTTTTTTTDGNATNNMTSNFSLNVTSSSSSTGGVISENSQ